MRPDEGRRRPFPPEAEARLRAQAKTELRTRISAVRRALPEEAREARSARIVERLRAFAPFASARMVLAYWPMRGEADPRAAFHDVWARGGSVALPRIDFGEADLSLHVFGPGEPLEESGLAFLQPEATRPRVAPDDVDVVLVPAVAVDARGFRIGLGKGVYDRLLPTLTRATSVALVFDFQCIAEVPNEAHDVAVRHVVTDRTDFAGRGDDEPCPGAY